MKNGMCTSWEQQLLLDFLLGNYLTLFNFFKVLEYKKFHSEDIDRC